MKYILFLIVLIFSGTLVRAQQKFTISGYVEDAGSSEKLLGAKVFVPELQTGAITNDYGFYSLTLPQGKMKVLATYLGFKTFATEFELLSDTVINIRLESEGVRLDTVQIIAEEESHIEDDPQMSSVKMTIEEIKSLPAFMGEVDVIKVFQLMPGVQSGNEGTTNLIVRGGSPDQNLILLDGVPVYNVSHLFGFFSVFNADAIKNVELIKGGFPARYGGRTSSVLDINMKDGNMKKIHGEATIGLIASKITLEGPIIKDKTSFIVSARRTYLDLLYKPIIAASTGGKSSFGYHFYDVNVKLNHKFSHKDRLYLSFYNGLDKFGFKEKDDVTDWSTGIRYKFEYGGGLDWGNTIGALRWNHLFSDKLFSNTTLTYSKYQFVFNAYQRDQTTGPGINENTYFEAKYFSGIRDYSLKWDFDFYPSPAHQIRFGAYGIYHKFSPGAYSLNFEGGGSSVDTLLGDKKGIPAWEAGAYVEDDFTFGRNFRANAGFHYSLFNVEGKTYHNPQPRISARYMLPGRWALKASWAHMAQYIHLLSNSSVGLPTDLWVPATSRVPFQRSRQAAIGMAKSFPKHELELSVEGYYKWMDDIIDYREGADFLLGSTDWQDNVVVGKGWSYGAEVLLQRKKGKVTGWIGYTLAWTKRQSPEVNNGKPYPYKYDRRHDFVTALTWQVKPNIDLGGVFIFASGNAVTLPVARYTGINPFISPFTGFPGGTVEYFGSRNGSRMRSYHRLDLSANFHKKIKWGESTWSISIYNVYSRLNPFFYYIGYNDAGKRVVKQVSIFPIVPSVSWRFKF